MILVVHYKKLVAEPSIKMRKGGGYICKCDGTLLDYEFMCNVVLPTWKAFL